MQDSSGETSDLAVSDDRFLDGRLLLRQPTRGHRLGTDAILLAAAAAARGRVADVGSGAGLVGLALALRGARETVLIERESVFADCAEVNIARVALAGVSLARSDVFRRRDFLDDPRLADQSFDSVATNPPYDQSIRARRTPMPLKLAAHAMQGGTLADWLATCVRLLRDGGVLTLIHRADKLAEVLAALPRRAGRVHIRPVQAQVSGLAERILVQAVAGSRAPLALLPPLVLNAPGGGFTREADAIHRGHAEIAME